jgi:hypothetical protein
MTISSVDLILAERLISNFHCVIPCLQPLVMLMSYAVWNLIDSKRRPGIRHRCFGYFHPAIPGWIDFLVANCDLMHFVVLPSVMPRVHVTTNVCVTRCEYQV